jgi:hypothetical protein
MLPQHSFLAAQSTEPVGCVGACCNDFDIDMPKRK